MSSDRLTEHLKIRQYGSFILPDAVRPSPSVPIEPRQGYRIQIFRDRRAQIKLPMLSAAVSADTLFDLFLLLLEPVGDVVHVFLESSHGTNADRHEDLRRMHIDLPVLSSHLCEFEDLILNDGCTGLAVMAERQPIEVQFDEHKLFHIYAPDLRPFRKILKRFGIRRRTKLSLISEAEHLHHTTDAYAEDFQQLCAQLGAGGLDSVYSEDNGEWHAYD